MPLLGPSNFIAHDLCDNSSASGSVVVESTDMAVNLLEHAIVLSNVIEPVPDPVPVPNIVPTPDIIGVNNVTVSDNNLGSGG